MSETALILNQATDRSLVLLDEIGRKTAHSMDSRSHGRLPRPCDCAIGDNIRHPLPRAHRIRGGAGRGREHAHRSAGMGRAGRLPPHTEEWRRQQVIRDQCARLAVCRCRGGAGRGLLKQPRLIARRTRTPALLFGGRLSRGGGCVFRSVRDALADIDPDGLTPRAALGPLQAERVARLMMRTLFMAALLGLLSIQTATEPKFRRCGSSLGMSMPASLCSTATPSQGWRPDLHPQPRLLPQATLLLPGAAMGKTVQPRIPIGKAGIKQIQIVQVGDGLQFTIEVDDARSLTTPISATLPSSSTCCPLTENRTRHCRLRNTSRLAIRRLAVTNGQHGCRGPQTDRG